MARPRRRRAASSPRQNPTKTHRDVEFMVEDPSRDGGEMYFNKFDEAAGNAVARAVSHGGPVYLDVLVSSRAGAKWVAGDDGAEMYDEDPEASVFERVVIKANSEGRIP